MSESESSPGEETPPSGGMMEGLIEEITGSTLNIVLVSVILFLIYKIIVSNFKQELSGPPPKPPLPKMSKRDFTVEELKPFDGNGEDGRILMAVNGRIYDVSRGKSFYGPEGPYSAFAGKDASRGLATFCAGEEAVREGYDDLSDLTAEQMESVREWEMQLKEKYDFVGRLLRPDEKHTIYEEQEDEGLEAGDKKSN